MPAREEPVTVQAKVTTTTPSHGAAIIFMHGFDSHAIEWEDVATQFQNGDKLPYMQWIFPNAMDNRDAMARAWYTPTSLTHPPRRPELADDEDEEGMLQSIKYVEGLIAGLTSKGVPLERIVVGGFSQGCAMSLLTALTSRYSGRLAGIVGLLGYLPIPDQIQQLRTEMDLPSVVGKIPMFLARGAQDRLIPKRKWEQVLEQLEALGVSQDGVEVHEYPGLAHAISPVLLRDLSAWLEKIVPALE